MLASKLLSSIGNTDKLYVDDVFSAYTYTGNEAGSNRSIDNGIDLLGKGGLVWTKSRADSKHFLCDTENGFIYGFLSSSSTDARNGTPVIYPAISGTGYRTAPYGGANTFGVNYVSWTFRKSPKFFDVVTYTGNGAGSRSIAHSLGVAPGMVIVKRTDTNGAWHVLARKSDSTWAYGGASYAFGFNTFEPALSRASVATDASSFAIQDIANGYSDTNVNGASYVAYLFAHDTSADGIVQCGSFTTDASGISTSQNLGWEPQYLMVKRINIADDWRVFDVMRGFGKPTYNSKALYPNMFNAEDNPSVGVEPEATGFKANGLLASSTYIYLAIRRQNKPPTSGTQVYNHLTRTGTGAVGSTTAVGFAPDLAISQSVSVGRPPTWVDRLRDVKKWIRSDTTSAEATQTTGGLVSLDMLGVSYTADNTESPFSWNNGGEDKHQRFFKRAPGFFDVVCFQSTTSADLSFSHGLGVVPDLIIHKDRGIGTDWDVWTTALGGKHYLKLNTTNAATSVGQPSTLTATSVFSGSGSQTSNSPQVCYLFATLPGISKVGNYTGNGSSQTINCGFSTGARFILIKRTDSAGDWYVWDTARGIVSANDPHLSLNTPAAEVTSNDSVDPDSTGFIVNQVTATNINVTGSTYLYLAIA